MQSWGASPSQKHQDGVFALHPKCNPKGEPHDVANETPDRSFFFWKKKEGKEKSPLMRGAVLGGPPASPRPA